MFKIALTLFFILLISISFCQRNEIGISVINYQANRDNSYRIDTSGYEKQNAINSLQPVLTFNHINSKNIDTYIQAGFFYSGGNASNKGSDNKTISFYSTSQSQGKSIYFKIGLAKRYYYEKLIFAVGVNIPFEYQFLLTSKTQSNVYDSAGILFQIQTTNDKRAPKFETGLNLNTSIFYNIFNNFYLGLDLNLGWISTINNGMRYYTSTYVNYPNNINQTTVADVKMKFVYTTELNFQPVIGIRYCLSEKKK